MFNDKIASQNTGWFLLISVAVWTILWPLFQDGMFTDGLLYASVSRNLAVGMGEFWNPHFSQTLFQNFHEQPPLVFWMQAQFFKVSPSSIYPERYYSLLFLILSIAAVLKIWQEKSTQNYFWPALLFIVIPTVQWGFINNIIENTMLFFDLLAVLFFWKSMKEKNGQWFLPAGILFTFLATFSKGFQGAFPLIVPLLFSISFEPKFTNKKAVIFTISTFLGIILIYGLILLSKKANISYQLYFESRFINFPSTTHANTSNRLSLLIHLFLQLLMPIMLSFGIWVILKIRKSTISAPSLQHKQNALFFLLIGISASLPLMVTFEQRGFYLNTSLPYFALALASYSENWLSDFQKSGLISTRIQRRIPVLLISIASLGIIGLLYFSGKPKRDSEQLNDFNIISKMVGKEGKMITTKACWENYTLHNYLQRYCQISLYYACDDCPYMIIPKNEYQSVSPEFQKLTLHTTYFNIYKRTYGIETKEPEF